MYLEVDDLLVLLSKLLLQLCSIVFGRLLLLCCFAFLLRLGWCGVRVPPYRRCCSCDGGKCGLDARHGASGLSGGTEQCSLEHDGRCM